jgi:hypothetical protein
VLTISKAVSDADYEQLRRVRMAVVPHERAATIGQMRAAARPDQLQLLAERDGEVVGSGFAGRRATPACAGSTRTWVT